MPDLRLSRHDLVWLTQDVRAATSVTACGRTQPQACEILAAWTASGRPVVVTRQPDDLAAGALRVGLPLSPAEGKQRLSFDVPVGNILRAESPPPLDAVSGSLPETWQATLHALLASPAIVAAEPRVFGSVAMFATTGLAYLTDESDLDLLLAPRSWAAALAVLGELSEIDACSRRPRIDGELVDPAGRAVAWRELAMDSRQVLVKSLAHVGLLERSHVQRGYAEARIPRIAP